MRIGKQPESPIMHFAYGAILGAIAGALFAAILYFALFRFGLGNMLGLRLIDPKINLMQFLFGGIIFGGLGGSFSGGIASPKWGILAAVLAIAIYGCARLIFDARQIGSSESVQAVILIISGVAGIIAGLAEHKLKIVRQRKPDPWDEYRNAGQRQQLHDSKEK